MKISRKEALKKGAAFALAGTALAPLVSEASGHCPDRCRCNRRGECCAILRTRSIQRDQCITWDRRCGAQNDICDCGGCP